MRKIIMVTGAAGFIGSSFARQAVSRNYQVIIVDALTYAGHMENIEEIVDGDQVIFEKVNLLDFPELQKLFKKYQFSGVVNFAAESHVDNSISGPKAFVETNITGTFHLLEAAREYWATLADKSKKEFRFLHVSTDEVFGALGAEGKFSETTAYAPNSPYSASKAASDHLVRAWFHTYGLPTVITNCSNNYGPRQFLEKLIPRMIQCALKGEALPVYGNGANIRDWIHVDDHASGVMLAFEKAKPGSNYCFGGNSERNNLEVVKSICRILDDLRPRKDGKKHEANIRFVEDRWGHDFRYAIDDRLAQKELGFTRHYQNFEDGLAQTVNWYLNNQEWSDKVTGQKK